MGVPLFKIPSKWMITGNTPILGDLQRNYLVHSGLWKLIINHGDTYYVINQQSRIWLVVRPPLWKIWVRQLGWLETQYFWGKKWQPNHQPEDGMQFFFMAQGWTAPKLWTRLWKYGRNKPSPWSMNYKLTVMFHSYVKIPNEFIYIYLIIIIIIIIVIIIIISIV